MNPANRELLAVAAQITSLKSLIAYRFHGPILDLANLALLILLTLLLLSASLRLPETWRLQSVAAWSALGLLFTYHRAHDAIVLMILLPWLFSRLQKSWLDPLSYALVALYLAMSLGLSWEFLQSTATHPVLRGIAEAILYRQAPLATLFFFILLATASLRAVPARLPLSVTPTTLSEISYLNTGALARK